MSGSFGWRLFGLIVALFFGSATYTAMQAGFPDPGFAAIGAACAAAGAYVFLKGPG